jgi:hypothetical protein
MDYQDGEGDDDLCCELLRKKYLRGGFFNSKPRGGLNFGKGYKKSNLLVRGVWNTSLGIGKNRHEVELGDCLWGSGSVDYTISVNNSFGKSREYWEVVRLIWPLEEVLTPLRFSEVDAYSKWGIYYFITI